MLFGLVAHRPPLHSWCGSTARWDARPMPRRDCMQRPNLMVLKWLANPIALLALGLSTEVQAADPVPDRVATFVAYCPTYFADCKSKVIEADVAVMATILFAKKGTQACAIPKGVDESAATKQILAWLGEHNDADA